MVIVRKVDDGSSRCVIHTQRQLAWTDVDDLAVEAQRLKVILADDRPVPQAEDSLRRQLNRGLPGSDEFRRAWSATFSAATPTGELCCREMTWARKPTALSTTNRCTCTPPSSVSASPRPGA